jgi:DNA-binding transcriptional MerR regulator
VNQSDPVQEYFSIGEVCELTGLRPHVLRYWESQFTFLRPTKNRSGNRVYQRREVELIMLVKHLLHTERYTIEGAQQKVDQHRKSADLRVMARGALNLQALEALEADLSSLLEGLDVDEVGGRGEADSAGG